MLNFADPTRQCATPFRLEESQIVDAPLQSVFDFFSDPGNLERITPPWMGFHIVSCSTDAIQEGTILEYALRVRGMPMKWRSLISEWNPPHSFVDEQIHGPYRRWHHRHTFEAIGDSTRIGDVVDYAVPGGRLIHRLLVRRDVRKIFDYRQKTIGSLLAELRTQES